MSSLAYYLISLGAALVVIAVASGMVARHLRRAQRRLQAIALLDALARSTDWVAAQARAVCFQAPVRPADSSLAEIRALQRQWFPELAGSMEALVVVHRRLSELLQMHQRLCGQDPEAWLEGGHDAAFLALRREHGAIVEAMEQCLAGAARTALPPRQRSFPA